MAYEHPPMPLAHVISHCRHTITRRFGRGLLPKSAFDQRTDTMKGFALRANVFIYDDASELATARDLLEEVFRLDPSGMSGDHAMRIAAEAIERETKAAEAK